MKATNVLMVIAVLAVSLAMFNLVITVSKVQDFQRFTGFAVNTTTAEVNLSVASNLLINFTTDSINWGSGYVNPGAGNAYLYTNNTVTGGTWSAVNGALVVENAGNENANITFKASNDAAGFIGTGAEYKINVTEGEVGSCAGGMVNNNTWNDINTTELLYCGNFTTGSSADQLDIHVYVMIPETGVAIGSKGSIITATAETI
jgi:hypothetical protein